MEHNCRDRKSLFLCFLVFIVAGRYSTILFGEQFIEPFDEENEDFHEEVNLMNLEVNWNWTLYPEEGFQIIIHK